MSLTINEGTQTDVYTVVNGGTEIGVVKLDVGAGSEIADFGGTIRDVANIAKGTITRVENGTIGLVTRTGNIGTIESGSVIVTNGTIGRTGNVGTIESGSVIVTNGTVNGTVSTFTKTVGSTILTTHTLGTAGGTTWGTLIAPVGAGTYVYVAGLSMVARSGTPDIAITTNVAGSTGAGVFARGAFAPGGGIMRNYHTPIQVGTNGTIAYMVLNGTADFTVDYWVGT